MELKEMPVILLMFLLYFIHTSEQVDVTVLDDYLQKSYPHNPATILNHFAMSETERSIYIGGVGRLYHLSRDFDVLANVSAGENNTNKILSIAPHPVNRLISCGSGLNGTCQLRHLDNLADTGDQTLSSLKVTEDENTTLGLVVNHPPGVAVSQALYVAKSIGTGGEAPVQARCLSTVESSCNDADKMTGHIRRGLAPNFLIKYAASFSYGNYTYFFASQLRDATDKTAIIVPKLSRVCHRDSSETMDSFTEITLECRGRDNTLYSIVQSAVIVDDQLFAVFVKNNGDAYFDPTHESALCVYDMKILIQGFDNATISCACFRTSETAFDHINYLNNAFCREDDSIQCDSLSIDLPCMLFVLARYPERSASLEALQGEIVYEDAEETFTSILITETLVQNATQKVAFIGSKEGHLLKVQFNDTQLLGALYEKLDVYQPVSSDAFVGNDTVMVLTERKLLELSVANCSLHQTCDDCLNGDPYCGWCTLEERCTRSTECTGSDDGRRWLPFYESTCVNISAKPESLSVTLAGLENITIHATHLPVGVNYSCHFGNFTTPAHRTSKSLTVLDCASPGLTYLPDFSEGDATVAVNLSLSSSEYSGTFVSIPYYFFNCSKISGCKDCTIRWDCEWCATDFTCNFNESSYCDSYITTDNECPVVQDDKFYIPNNIFRNITVTVETPSAYSAVSSKSYECVVSYLGENETSQAQLSDNSTDQFSLTCDAAKYNYAANEKEVPAELRIRSRENGVYLDGAGNVTLYKCEVDRPDCSRCLSNITTPMVLNCGWCSSQSKCAVSENCPQTIQQVCTDPPEITKIYPSSGPVAGGTMVQINGTNLGQRFSDIDSVTLGGTVCNHTECEEEYKVGESITCIAGEVEDVGDVKVSVVIMDSTAIGDLTFSYRLPEFSSFDPVVGPASGGTLITISGTDLDTGRNIEASLGDEGCRIESKNSTCIQCINTNSSVNSNHTLTLLFDGYNVSLDGELFAYKEDPEITSVDPTTFIKAGGNFLTVFGARLDIIKTPKIVFTVDEGISQQTCIHQGEDGSEMTCKSPEIRTNSARRRRATQDGGKVDVGFIMDGVSDLRHWSMNTGEEIMYVPNPDYENFTIMNFSPESSILTLKGTNLSAGSQEKDVEVYIGTEECEVVSLNEDSVLCTPPKDQPPAGNRYGNDTEKDFPVVTVQHANLYFRLGPVRYVNQLFLILQIAVPIVAFLVIVLLCIMVWMWYIRKKKGDKIKDLEIQMREIQDSVSGNLKSLFATLQTTMHDFDSALEQRQIIPLHAKRQYILNMLFLGLQVEPPSQPSEEVIDNEKLKFAMQEFSSKLLSKKNFLEVLVRTIDGCTNIGAMDRVNIASLLSVCLLQDGKQELLSNVLISLMREQIEECDGKRNKYRILFSRNETVLEKLLSNWVTLFLYKYFKDDAATPFYQLYHAIKYVCEMGPIDAVTGKSQFSINDQWMLESQVDFNDLNLEVISNSVTGEKISVGVLDVNTISQVKDKIISQLYKDSSFSSQPSPHDYDLMWRVGMGGQLILRDEEDLAGNTENGWRKLNTLADFNVNSEHACFELVERQQNPNAAIIDPSASAKLGDYNDANGKSGFKGRNEAFGRSMKAPWVPQGCKVWHLVKDEDQNEEQEEKITKPKEIKEVVLPFLPATRNYIQKYVDAVLNVMFADQNPNIPKAIRYLFQFFDREAGKLNDEDFAKAWKDNVLALRYWTTIIANPQYPLDIGMESYTQACLRILVQVVKDTCAGRNKPNRSQDFSPSRLLYSSFLPGYINKLSNYYSHVQSLGRVDSEDLTLECNLLQENFADTFDLTSTQYELFKFLQTYGDVLQKGLEEDDVCEEADMVGKFQSLVETVGPVPARENFYDPVES